MALKFDVVFDREAKKNPDAFVDADGNLVMHVTVRKGVYRFLFEVGQGSFDPDMMFLNVYGVKVGPTARLWRVPGMTDYTDKTRDLPTRQMVCPIVEVYRDHAFVGSALTEFPSVREFEAGYHIGEFAVELDGGRHEIKLVNGRGYTLDFLKVSIRKDERTPRKHTAVKPELAGVHPRLFFTDESLDAIKARAKGGSKRRYQLFRESIRKRLDAIDGGVSPNALDVATFGFMFAMTGRKRYLQIARQGLMMLLATSLPGPEEGRNEVNGAEPGKVIETACCFYDFCYSHIDDALRTLIRETLTRVMRWWMNYIKFNSLEWPGNPGGMEHSAYNYHAVGLAGLTFLGEIDDAQEWLDWAYRHYDLARQRMLTDGSLGMYPKEHSFEAFFNYAAALRHATGENMLDRWPFFHHLPADRIQRETGARHVFPSFYGPDYPPGLIAWETLASLTKNPEAQWLAERYREKVELQRNETITSSRHLNLSRQYTLWAFLHHDPQVDGDIDFDTRPVDRLHKGTDLGILRSGWFEPDTVEAALYSGIATSRKVLELEHRVSYAQPPAGNMVAVYGYGERLAGCTAQSYHCESANFATLTIEGDGQIEEGTVFGCRKTADQVGRIVGYHPGKRISYVAGEASPCYYDDIGLTRYTRHVIFVKPDVVLVFDQVDLDRPRGAEIHFAVAIQPPKNLAGKQRRGKLRLLDETTAHFAGRQAGLIVATPSALKRTLTQTRAELARGYVDLNSEYRRITFASDKARSHRFLTLLYPLPDRTLKHRPEITETVTDEAILWRIDRGETSIRVALPTGDAAVSFDGIEFRGALLVGHSHKGTLTDLAGVDVTECAAPGIRPRRRKTPSPCFVQV